MTIYFKKLKQILKPKAYKDFMKYIYGQTTDTEGATYDHDFTDWVKGKEPMD